MQFRKAHCKSKSSEIIFILTITLLIKKISNLKLSDRQIYKVAVINFDTVKTLKKKDFVKSLCESAGSEFASVINSQCLDAVKTHILSPKSYIHLLWAIFQKCK